MSCPYQKDANGIPSAPAQICDIVQQLTGQNVRGEWHGTDNEIAETLARWDKDGIPYELEMGPCQNCDAPAPVIGPARWDDESVTRISCQECGVDSVVFPDEVSRVKGRYFPGMDGERGPKSYSSGIEAANAAREMFESLGEDPNSPMAQELITELLSGDMRITRGNAANMGRMAQAVKRREQRELLKSPDTTELKKTIEETRKSDMEAAQSRFKVMHDREDVKRALSELGGVSLRGGYSGRGMMGQECSGIAFAFEDDLEAFHEVLAEENPELDARLRAVARRDSMGNGGIEYYPGINLGEGDWDPNYDNFDEIDGDF